MKISQVSEMRAMDRTAIEQYGITEELLMENAGHAANSVLMTEVRLTHTRFMVCCGLGNIGADGFVVARKIHSCGGTVQVYILGDQSAYQGAAKLHFDILARLPIPISQLTSVATVQPEMARCDVIIDAIFG